MPNLIKRKPKILNGAFQNLEATIIAVYPQRVIVEVEVLGRVVKTTLQLEDLELSEIEKLSLQQFLLQDVSVQPSPVLQKITPGFEMRISPIRICLRRNYGFDFPDEFFLFWQFYQQLPEKSIGGGFGAALDMSLGEVFDVFKTDIDLDTFNPLEGFRYYYDPPEFFSLILGHIDGLHWGYYLDDPDHQSPFQVAYYYANDAFELRLAGYSIFEAVRWELERNHQQDLENIQDDPKEKEYHLRNLARLEIIRNLLKQYCTGERDEIGADYVEKYALKRNFIAPTRDRMGIILPEKLYKPLPDKDIFTDSAEGWNYQPTPEHVDKITQKALKLLEKGFPGAAFKLGKDLWTYPLFHRQSFELLDKAYQALERPTLRRMLHLFRKEAKTQEIPEFEQALQNPNCQELSLQDKNLGELSAEIKSLKNLKTLNLSFNNLAELPKEIGDLAQLENLLLNLNVFTHFPTAVCRLKSLKLLNLSDNYLSQIPDEIVELQQLEVLWLDNNKFIDFPKAICGLKNLQALYLRKNSIHFFPKEIEKLLHLEKLCFQTDRKVKSIASNINKLSKLKTVHWEYFDAQNINIDEIMLFPPELCTLPYLEELKIGTNKILEFPVDFTHLTQLKSLQIDNYLLKEIPSVILELPLLEELHIHGAKIYQIPKEIQQLRCLKTLSLFGNKITQIPDELANLKNLQTLNLKSNSLDDATIQRLKKLLPNTLIQT